MNFITSPLGYALKNEERQEPAPKIDLSSPVDSSGSKPWTQRIYITYKL